MWCLDMCLAKQLGAERQTRTCSNTLIACRFRDFSSDAIFRWRTSNSLVNARRMDLIVREHAKSWVISFDWKCLWIVGQACPNLMKRCTPYPSWYRSWEISPATTVEVVIVSNESAIFLWIAKHVKDRSTIWMPEECPKIDWYCRESTDHYMTVG